MSKFDKVPVPIDLVLGRETDNKLKNEYVETSLAVQWLRILPSCAADVGWIPGQGTKISCAIEQLSLSTATTEAHTPQGRPSADKRNKNKTKPKSLIRNVMINTVKKIKQRDVSPNSQHTIVSVSVLAVLARTSRGDRSSKSS